MYDTRVINDAHGQVSMGNALIRWNFHVNRDQLLNGVEHFMHKDQHFRVLHFSQIVFSFSTEAALLFVKFKKNLMRLIFCGVFICYNVVVGFL